ncbi:MAG: hypothetical protein IPL61_32090 [Myxococcales bacterium]|nr:hypothetical protein [Myxococcales bacterium]
MLRSIRVLDVQRTLARWNAIWSVRPEAWVRRPSQPSLADATGLGEGGHRAGAHAPRAWTLADDDLHS